MNPVTTVVVLVVLFCFIAAIMVVMRIGAILQALWEIKTLLVLLNERVAGQRLEARELARILAAEDLPQSPSTPATAERNGSSTQEGGFKPLTQPLNAEHHEILLSDEDLLILGKSLAFQITRGERHPSTFSYTERMAIQKYRASPGGDYPRGIPLAR